LTSIVKEKLGLCWLGGTVQFVRFFDKVNSWKVMLALSVLFLALISFVLYPRYQSALQEARDNSASQLPVETATTSNEEPASSLEKEPSTTEETTSEETASKEPTSEEAASQGIASEEAASQGTAYEEMVPFLAEDASELEVVVWVVDAPTWLTVQEDGQDALDQEIQPGFSRQFEADQALSIWTANAGATWVEVNGYDLGPLGASGEVATRTFTAGA
jgi:hypothetical protein